MLRILAVVAVLLTAGQVNAGDRVSGISAELVQWIAQNTRYKNPGYLPKVGHADRCRLGQIHRPKVDCVNGREVRAFYNRKQIWIQTAIYQPIASGDTFNTSVLLHELVHFMQHKNGVPMTSKLDRCRREAEAYSLQIKWLQSKGWSYSSARRSIYLTPEGMKAKTCGILS